MTPRGKTVAWGLSGGLVGGALILLLGSSTVPQGQNKTFQTQTASSPYLFSCQQEIVYQDNTKEKKQFFTQADQTSVRQCIESNTCNSLKIITTSCKEFNQ